MFKAVNDLVYPCQIENALHLHQPHQVAALLSNVLSSATIILFWTGHDCARDPLPGHKRSQTNRPYNISHYISNVPIWLRTVRRYE